MTLVGVGAERWRARIDMEPFATLETCYDRGFGATASSLAPYEELTGKHLRKTRLDHPLGSLLGSLLDWRGLFAKVVVLREDELDGRQVWVVKLVADDELSVTAWIDAETGDTLREDSSEPFAGGELPTTTTFSDFRELEGLRLPGRVESQDAANGKSVLTLDSFEARLALGEDAFRLAPPDPGEH